MDKKESILLRDFLESVNRAFDSMDETTFWPLAGGQICASFNMEHALDVYRLTKQLETMVDIKGFCELLVRPGIIKYLLINTIIVGLKKAKIKDLISSGEINRYVFSLFKILSNMLNDDIFSLGGSNIVLAKNETRRLIKSLPFKKATEDYRKLVAFLGVDLFSLCSSYYFDIFIGAGFETYGPYDTKEFFGPGTNMIVKDFFDLKPNSLWNLEEEFPFSSVKIYQIIKDVNWSVDFINHPNSDKPIGPNTIYSCVETDNQPLDNFRILNSLCNKAEFLCSKQTAFVNNLSNIDQVKMGCLINYYMVRNLFGFLHKPWRPKMELLTKIENDAEKYIRLLKPTKTRLSSGFWKKMYDPRNKFIG